MKKTYPNKEEEGIYINNVERMDPVDIIKYVEKANREQMNLKSMRSTYIRSGSKIQSTHNRFKVIGFMNSKRGQPEKQVENKKYIAYLAGILVVLNNNSLLLKDNIEYALAMFMQYNNMTKGLMRIFFNNLDLVLIWKYLSYKSVDEIKALLIKLLYSKVTWWTKSINIYLVIANVASKEYLIYYLDIISAIYFLIGHYLFA